MDDQCIADHDRLQRVFKGELSMGKMGRINPLVVQCSLCIK